MYKTQLNDLLKDLGQLLSNRVVAKTLLEEMKQSYVLKENYIYHSNEKFSRQQFKNFIHDYDLDYHYFEDIIDFKGWVEELDLEVHRKEKVDFLYVAIEQKTLEQIIERLDREIVVINDQLLTSN